MVGVAPGARIRSCYCIRNGQYEGWQCRYFVGILQVKQYGTKLLLFCLANIPSIYAYHLQNFPSVEMENLCEGQRWSLASRLSGVIMGFPGDTDTKESACNARNLGSIPGLGRSPGEGNGNPLQYSCLENPMDRGAWRATVHEVTKSWTWLSN